MSKSFTAKWWIKGDIVICYLDLLNSSSNLKMFDTLRTAGQQFLRWGIRHSGGQSSLVSIYSVKHTRLRYLKTVWLDMAYSSFCNDLEWTILSHLYKVGTRTNSIINCFTFQFFISIMTFEPISTYLTNECMNRRVQDRVDMKICQVRRKKIRNAIPSSLSLIGTQNISEMNLREKPAIRLISTV